jgi:hypothetical protein
MATGSSNNIDKLIVKAVSEGYKSSKRTNLKEYYQGCFKPLSEEESQRKVEVSFVASLNNSDFLCSPPC